MVDAPKITDVTKEYPEAVSAEKVRFALGRIVRTGGSAVVMNIDGHIWRMTPEDAMSIGAQLYQAGEYLKENPDFENKLRN